MHTQRAQQVERHQLVEGEGYRRDVAGLAQETVDFFPLLPVGGQGIARLLDRIQVAVDGSPVDITFLGQVIQGHVAPRFQQPDDRVQASRLGILFCRFTFLHGYLLPNSHLSLQCYQVQHMDWGVL
jgi:hypothetical protein